MLTRRPGSSSLLCCAFLFVFCPIVAVTSVPAQAQSYQVIHDFTGGGDGYAPQAGLTMDRAGNFYGTTTLGGNGSLAGVAFKLTRSGSAWLLSPIHQFAYQEGSHPNGLTIGPDGALYGTASQGGGTGGCNGHGCGTVFKLTPQLTFCHTTLCPWNLSVIYRFIGGSDGGNPVGKLVFDQAGNFYGATGSGGNVEGGCRGSGCGVVFEFSPSHGSWTETVLHSFADGSDGTLPSAGVKLDSIGNIYGVTMLGAGGGGSVYELSHSGQGWSETILYRFSDPSQGRYPEGALIFDAAGNLYGTTNAGGNTSCVDCGTVYELSPSAGGWTHTMLYAFNGVNGDQYPLYSLSIDSSGNLYGTTYGPNLGMRFGNIFELVRTSGGWMYISLYEFTGGTDGGQPVSDVVWDTDGNMFGTANTGGYAPNCINNPSFCGVLWELTP